MAPVALTPAKKLGKQRCLIPQFINLSLKVIHSSVHQLTNKWFMLITGQVNIKGKFWKFIRKSKLYTEVELFKKQVGIFL